MAQITYIAFDGTERAVDVKNGASVMEGAVRNGISGIEAECGGCCSCATCQVYVDEAWRAAVGGPSKDETSILDFAPGLQPNSRLSCQIKVSDALDGLVVRMPQSQR